MAETITKVHYVYVKDEATGKKQEYPKRKSIELTPNLSPNLSKIFALNL